MKLKVEYIPIDDLKPYENNAKIHTDEQIAQIKKSINEFGMNDPIGIWGKDNLIVEGHGRLIACKELGLKEVPIIRLDDLTDEQRKAYTLIHNQTTMNTGFDLDILNEELVNIEMDLSDFGFEIELDDIDEEQEIIEDEVPEVDEEPQAQYGDIYQLGNHRLMCGDSTNEDDVAKLMNSVKADMVFTDPPYGMNLDTNYSKLPSHLKNGNRDYSKIIGDNEDFTPSLITTIFDNFNNCNEIFIFGADYFAELLQNKNNGSWLVWDKRVEEKFDRMIGSAFELCWSKNKHKREIIRCNNTLYSGEQDAQNKVHPTQKPIKVITWILDKYSKENDLIVDIYGGSGSTLIACEQLNRKCYMMELDPHYIDVIIARWENFTGKKAVKI